LYRVDTASVNAYAKLYLVVALIVNGPRSTWVAFNCLKTTDQLS